MEAHINKRCSSISVNQLLFLQRNYCDPNTEINSVCETPDDQHLEESRHIEGANAEEEGSNKTLNEEQLLVLANHTRKETRKTSGRL